MNSASNPPTPYFSKLPSWRISRRWPWPISGSSGSGGGAGIKFRFPAGPAMPPDDALLMSGLPSVGALTTVVFGLGFSAGFVGARAPPLLRTPNAGGFGFGFGFGGAVGGADEDDEGAERDDSADDASIAADAARISFSAASRSSSAFWYA